MHVATTYGYEDICKKPFRKINECTVGLLNALYWKEKCCRILTKTCYMYLLPIRIYFLVLYSQFCYCLMSLYTLPQKKCNFSEVASLLERSVGRWTLGQMSFLQCSQEYFPSHAALPSWIMHNKGMDFGWYNLEMDAWINHETDAWINHKPIQLNYTVLKKSKLTPHNLAKIGPYP